MWPARDRQGASITAAAWHMVCISSMAARQDEHFFQRCWLQCQHALLILFNCCQQVMADSWFESTHCQRLPNRSDCMGRMDGSWLRPWADELKVTRI